MSEHRNPLPPPPLMVRKFLEYKVSEDPRLDPKTFSKSPEAGSPRTPFREGYFFFYGTLMHLSTLAKILQLPEPPQMRPARVIGYEIKLWGQYPALVDGEAHHPVDGLAYEIISRAHWDRLAAYETDQYDLQPILIDFLDNGEKGVEGVAFGWKGELEDLRDGSFNLENWLQEQTSNER
ncbi:uncharacterized protein N7477_000279 [Penicillium maclennaniae]|uniref:uncharacterized protein n=1 Tax=Penicillium maclennaniae TaxID=1343394 RepID=UPI002540132C|nr:uncharacterized protein N7477_000279 [Penicillium maclennaniae]KAJ5683934.1 hypothetical protein N7477_000279 [Penicillium maclennaniae]